jgi:hypothetical protein
VGEANHHHQHGERQQEEGERARSAMHNWNKFQLQESSEIKQQQQHFRS